MTVVVRLLLALLLNCSLEARKTDKRRMEILHKGKPLEELVALGAHIDPHDVKGLAELIKPKLMEETQQERMMLQQNGVEDPYPLDATIEYEGKKKLPKPIVATENAAFQKDKTFDSYEDPANTKFNVNEMPEYNVETKADFQGNQEAAEWLMHDPNRFNVMPEDDSKTFFSDGGNLRKPFNDDFDKQDEKDFSNAKYENEEYSKYQNSFANANKFDLSDSDRRIIEKAYRLDDEDSTNSDILGVSNGNVSPEENVRYLSKFSSSDDQNSREGNVAGYKESHGNESSSYKPLLHVQVDDDEKPKEDKLSVKDSDSEPTVQEPKAASQEIYSLKQKHTSPKAENSDRETNDREGEDAPNKEPNQILPIYRISKVREGNDENSAYQLSKSAPLSESGTSRQHVLMNSENNDFEDPQELSSRLGGLADIMFSKADDKQISGFYNGVHKTKSLHLVHSYATPQEPVEGQGRHGIPTKFGQWNGWSKCSVSCSKGTQIRARICINLPCQSRDLYQTRTCTKDVCPDDWREESLRAHNQLRELHHSPPLVWSSSLAKKAKDLADTLASMDYIGSQDLSEEIGENIAQLRQSENIDSLAQKAVDLWHKEASSYSYSYPQLKPSNRHFVQMVWKKTKTLGMASTRSRSGEYTFVVALYGGPTIDNKHLRDNVLRSGHRHDVYTTFKRSKPSHQLTVKLSRKHTSSLS